METGRVFARSFGDALETFLQEKRMTHSEAARRLGLGKSGIARLGTYCHDSPRGTRSTPSADLLYLICSELDFEFEYNGCKISALSLGMNGSEQQAPQPQQLSLPYERQFNLTDHEGTVSVSVKRPAGHVEVSISLKAVS
jgi:transcriptional regulator with XRE-family HTH domain